MKKVKILSLGLIVSFVAAIGVASVTSAMWSPNFRSSADTVTIAKDSTHTGSLYAAGENVTIDGAVTGTVYCVGETITINGSVAGDVLCAGQKVIINGTVAGDVRAAGQFVEVNGAVGGSLTAFAQDVRIDKAARIADDVNGAAQQFTINGVVGRDLAVGAQLLALDGEVKGNVDAAIEQLRLGSQSLVLGNLNYSATKEASVDESRVSGSVSFNPAKDHQSSSRYVSGTKLLFLLMLVASAIGMVLIMPRFVDRSSELFRQRIMMTILLGFTFVFGAPILVSLLLLSVILLPFGLALLFVWCAVLVLSSIFFAYWVGAELLRSQPNIIMRMLGGVAIIVVALTIPVLGGFVLFASVVVGSGMIVTTLTNGYKRPNYRIAAPKKAKKVAAK